MSALENVVKISKVALRSLKIQNLIFIFNHKAFVMFSMVINFSLLFYKKIFYKYCHIREERYIEKNVLDTYAGKQLP
jgi:hypothetical protein